MYNPNKNMIMGLIVEMPGLLYCKLNLTFPKTEILKL